MTTYKYYVVNVFSENGLYGGNPLGVVLNADSLDERQMQAIARQFNYSESTFITSINEKGGNVRIFLPNREIPFAGHPSLGTAYVLEKEYQFREKKTRKEVVLSLQQGDLRVQKKQVTNEDLWVMDQFPVKELGEYTRRQEVLTALGLKENQVMSEYPFLLITPSDLPFLFIPVQSPQVLQSMNPKHEQIKKALEPENADVYVFSLQGIDGGHVHARFFAPNSGIVEDPATGSAQHALMTYLEKTSLLDFSERTSPVIVEQGYEMKRPSKLYNFISVNEDGKIKEVRTGGKVSKIAKGVLYVK